jgi:hypothetical protein
MSITSTITSRACGPLGTTGWPENSSDGGAI